MGGCLREDSNHPAVPIIWCSFKTATLGRCLCELGGDIAHCLLHAIAIRADNADLETERLALFIEDIDLDPLLL
ncbi:hypothetical protein [Rhizobium leguminosarum]|uniref:hypothetical protein n=1 Tax=Rhizobium leguminosarum TaxID=384 RepID=UPI0021BBBBF8|nr:hypothetical protein [Rhizobium leguminosarum]